MTCGASFQRIAGQAECQPVLFPLAAQTGWRVRTERDRTNVVVGSFLPPSPPFLTPASGSSIALPAFPEAMKIWQEVGVSTVRSFELQVLWLWQLYAFRRPEEVSWFLQAHPFLVPLLLEAHGKIAEYFGPSPEVVLEVVTDLEVHGMVEMLGYIVVPLTPEEAGERLQQFDRQWFLLEVHRANGLLNFDVEFR